MDNISRKKRSYVMSRIRSKNTKPELDFMKRHKVKAYQPKLPFSPDFILADGTVMFLDSSFWHCDIPQKRFDKMKGYWRDKLVKNLMRDLSADSFWIATAKKFKRTAV